MSWRSPCFYSPGDRRRTRRAIGSARMEAGPHKAARHIGSHCGAVRRPTPFLDHRLLVRMQVAAGGGQVSFLSLSAGCRRATASCRWDEEKDLPCPSVRPSPRKQPASAQWGRAVRNPAMASDASGYLERPSFHFGRPNSPQRSPAMPRRVEARRTPRHEGRVIPKPGSSIPRRAFTCLRTQSINPSRTKR